MIDAEGARVLTEIAEHERHKNDLRKILVLIASKAKEGCRTYSQEGKILPNTIDELEKLGFSVEITEAKWYPQSFWSAIPPYTYISW